MRLQKIILDGFKSFADRTEFVFDSDITGIVGPNGCGKSNVVDAVKWVLGEQKVKNLRSTEMADVIFGGSGSRKPLGSAEVTIVFSNPQGSSGPLPIDTEEVAVSRRIFRSGDCEYRINGKLCRLEGRPRAVHGHRRRDTRLLDHRAGPGRSVGQRLEGGPAARVRGSGRDQQVQGPQERGPARKLERTEQNLLRLADILEEVAKRLRSVKLQAGKARNYLEYSQRLKELQVNFSMVEYGKNQRAARREVGRTAHGGRAVLRRIGRRGGRRGGGEPAGKRDHRQRAPAQRDRQFARGRPEQDRSEAPTHRVSAARTVELEQRRSTAAREIERLRPGRSAEVRLGEAL